MFHVTGCWDWLDIVKASVYFIALDLTCLNSCRLVCLWIDISVHDLKAGWTCYLANCTCFGIPYPLARWSNRASKGLVEVTNEPWVLYLVLALVYSSITLLALDWRAGPGKGVWSVVGDGVKWWSTKLDSIFYSWRSVNGYKLSGQCEKKCILLLECATCSWLPVIDLLSDRLLTCFEIDSLFAWIVLEPHWVMAYPISFVFLSGGASMGK